MHEDKEEMSIQEGRGGHKMEKREWGGLSSKKKNKNLDRLRLTAQYHIKCKAFILPFIRILDYRKGCTIMDNYRRL